MLDVGAGDAYGNIETCPDCGKPDIRPALEHEIAEFHSYQQELESRSHA